MKYGVAVASPRVAMRSISLVSVNQAMPCCKHRRRINRTIMEANRNLPARLGFNREPTAEPTARAPRSANVNGTWPG